MTLKSASIALKPKIWIMLFAMVAGVSAGALTLAFSQPKAAEAHCDSVNGPVVRAAQESLDTGNVNPVLAYVQPDDEAEITAAFEKTLQVRKQGGEAKELADQYFFETVVRLHRAGEGAPYTGLKYETDYGPALEAADKALADGSLKDVYALLNGALEQGLHEKYGAVVASRENAAREGTVESDRERAEAELLFEKYVDGLYKTAQGTSVAGEGAAPAPTAGHAH